MPTTKSTKSKSMTKASKKSPVKKETEPIVENDPDITVCDEDVCDEDVSENNENNVSDTEGSDGDLETVMSICKRMSTRRSQILSLQREDRQDARILERLYQQEIRSLRKKKSHRGGSNGTGAKKAPSGFAKPTAISSELRVFLDVPADALLARTDVTKRITTYIKDRDLQNPDNRREIFPDEKLRKLVYIPEEYENKLTYFNLQRCIKHHFPKAGTA